MRDLREIICQKHAKITSGLAAMFHDNSELTRQNLDEFAAQITTFGEEKWRVQPEVFYPYKEKLALPKISLGRLRGWLSFARLLYQRRSRRTFSDRPMTIQEVARLLYLSYGRAPVGDYLFSTVPSAGALFPLHIYLIARQTELPVGVYHYFFRAPMLDVIRKFASSTQPDLSFILTQNLAKEPPLYVVITAELKDTCGKYGDRGYRFALIECGHLAQNILLVAESLKLAAVALGGFLDRELAAFLELDYCWHKPLYVIALGHPATKY
jgi:SagB-type dehydrogenase family enzyme